MTEKPPVEKSGMLSNILAVIGLVILVVIISWGVVRLGAFSGSWLSSLSSILFPSSKSIRVIVPAKKIPSGERFAISWKYSPKTAGSYALLYQCHEGFQFKTTVADSGQNAIPCGIGYTLASKDNTFNVTPILAGTSSLDVPLSIIFIPSAPVATGTPLSQAQGNATVTVVNPVPAGTPAEIVRLQANQQTSWLGPNQQTSWPGLPITQSAPVPELVATKTPAPAAESELPDLSVRILSEGVIDPISGNIISRAPTSPNDLVAVRFLISNAGSSATGAWYFTAQLPTSPAYLYTSPAQTSLAHGASIENMLRFKNAVPSGVFSVTVDPINEVRELKEGNNTASVSI